MEVIEAFKVCKKELEKQINKTIKIVRSYTGGKYYSRYTDMGQRAGPFVNFLKEEGILAQYTMLGTP